MDFWFPCQIRLGHTSHHVSHFIRLSRAFLFIPGMSPPGHQGCTSSYCFPDLHKASATQPTPLTHSPAFPCRNRSLQPLMLKHIPGSQQMFKDDDIILMREKNGLNFFYSFLLYLLFIYLLH